jgi:hypothetical protein
VLAFLASRIDSTQKNLEPVQENFSASKRAELLGVGVRRDAPARLSVVLAQHHAAALAPGTRKLMRLAAEARDHDAAAATGTAGLRPRRLGGLLGHAARD